MFITGHQTPRRQLQGTSATDARGRCIRGGGQLLAVRGGAAATVFRQSRPGCQLQSPVRGAAGTGVVRADLLGRISQVNIAVIYYFLPESSY